MVRGLLLMAALFLLVHVPQAKAADLENSQSFKATVVENGVEFEWEYDNPNEFEYEHGNTVVKNDDAKLQVEKVYQYLKISPNAKVEQMAALLKKDGHVNLDRIQIKWIDQDGKLYTWVWNKKS